MAQKYAKDQPKGFTNRIENVAIVGAGGSVGKYLAEALLQSGKHTVTAISRSAGGKDFPSGIKVAQVDYGNEESLVKALIGQQFLIISLAVTAPPDTQAKLASAAAKAGVSWVMPNCWGPDFMDESLAKECFHGATVRAGIEDVEKAGGPSWTALANSFWYEFSLAIGPQCYGFDLPNKKVTFFDDGKTKINTSTWLQCGRAVANFLSLKELPENETDSSPTVSRWRNKPLYISSFLVSQRDMLDSLHKVLGTTDKDWTIKYEPSAARYKRGLELMAEGKQVGFQTCLYTRVMYPNGGGNVEEKYGLANEALGLPKEDLDEATKRCISWVEAGWKPYS